MFEWLIWLIVALILLCVEFLSIIWLTVALVLFYVELNSELRLRPRLRPDLSS